MKKLALLFLVLPLPAFAESASAPETTVTPTNSLIARPYAAEPASKRALEQIATAETHCRASGVGPSDAHYSNCVTGYLQEQYGITLARGADGTLVVARYQQNEWNTSNNWVSFGNPFGIQTPPPQTPGR